MSLRLGMAVAALDIERMIQRAKVDGKGVDEILVLLQQRRGRLAASGKRGSLMRAARCVIDEVYEVLLGTEDDDDLDQDVMPQVEVVVLEALGYRARGEED